MMKLFITKLCLSNWNFLMPKSVRDTKIQETLDRLTNSGFRYAISKMVLPALAPVADAADRAEALNMRIIMLGQQSDAGNLEELDLPETLLEDPFGEIVDLSHW